VISFSIAITSPNGAGRFPLAEVHSFSDAGHYVLEDVPHRTAAAAEIVSEAPPLPRLKNANDSCRFFVDHQPYGKRWHARAARK